MSVEYQSTNDTLRRRWRATPRGRDSATVTTGRWRTMHSSFQLLEGEGTQARVEIHGRGHGAEKGIRIRSILVTEAGAPVVATTSLYKFSAADTAGFKAAVDNNGPQAGASLPADWFANCWKVGDAGEIGVAEIGGRRALFIQNAAGSISTQTWTSRDLAELKAGESYEVRLTYFGEAQAKGHLTSGGRQPGFTVRSLPLNRPTVGGRRYRSRSTRPSPGRSSCTSSRSSAGRTPGSPFTASRSSP